MSTDPKTPAAPAVVPPVGPPVSAAPAKRTAAGVLESKALTEDELKHAKSADHCTFHKTGKDSGVVVAVGGTWDNKQVRAFENVKDATEWCEANGLVLRVPASQ